MPSKKLTCALLLAVLPLILGFSPSEEAHGSALKDILGKTVNFLILFGGLGFLLAKPLRKFLEDAGLAVAQTIRKTETAKRSAEKKLEALQARIRGLESEVRKIKEEGREAGREDKERLMAQARKEIDRLKSLAELEIEMHGQSAQAELRRYGAERAVSMAEKNIAARMTPELHSLMIDHSIRRLDGLYEKDRSR